MSFITLNQVVLYRFFWNASNIQKYELNNHILSTYYITFPNTHIHILTSHLALHSKPNYKWLCQLAWVSLLFSIQSYIHFFVILNPNLWNHNFQDTSPQFLKIFFRFFEFHSNDTYTIRVCVLVDRYHAVESYVWHTVSVLCTCVHLCI